MLDGLFLTPAITIIDEALASAKADGPIAVVGSARLAKALGSTRDVIAVDLPARAARKHAGKVVALADLDPRGFAAIVGTDATDEALVAWSRAVRDGGAVITVDREPAEASRRALCAGLTELQQRHSGRLVVTSGLVSHL